MGKGRSSSGETLRRGARAFAVSLVFVTCLTGCEGGCAGCREVRDQAGRAAEAAKRGAGAAREGAADIVAAMQVPETIATAKNLRQIGAALRAYHDAYGAFPPYAHRAHDGRPLLSWRVLILPHLGDDEAALFKEFRLDEPWDGPHNRTLLNRMPKVYAPPDVRPATTPTSTRPAAPATQPAEPHLTYFRVFTGPATVFEEGRRVSLADVKDGVDRTVLVVEARDPVPWTRPEALALVPGGPRPSLGLLRSHFMVVYCDGVVGSHSQTLGADDLAAMLSITGGEAFNPRGSGREGGGSGWDWD